VCGFLQFSEHFSLSPNEWLAWLLERRLDWVNPAYIPPLARRLYRASRLRRIGDRFGELRARIEDTNLSMLDDRGKLASLPTLEGDAAAMLESIEPPDLDVPFGESVNQFARESVNGEQPPPFLLGIHAIDRKLEIRPKHLCVVGATRSSGKSTICGQVALNLASAGYGVLLLALEMTTEEFIERMVCNVAGVSVYEVRNGGKSDGLKTRIMDAAAQIRGLPIIVEEPKPELDNVRAVIQRHVKARNVRVVILDHIQCIHDAKGRHGSRALEVAAVSGALKQLAKEYGIAVVCASQINRDGAKEEPQLHHLRDSGAIENDADQVVLVWKREDGTVQFRIPKNRHGATTGDWQPLDIDFVTFRVNAGNVVESEAIYGGDDKGRWNR
jgi:archaellum biogenesis ATPase FlaH